MKEWLVIALLCVSSWGCGAHPERVWAISPEPGTDVAVKSYVFYGYRVVRDIPPSWDRVWGEVEDCLEQDFEIDSLTIVVADSIVFYSAADAQGRPTRASKVYGVSFTDRALVGLERRIMLDPDSLYLWRHEAAHAIMRVREGRRSGHSHPDWERCGNPSGLYPGFLGVERRSGG